MSEKTNFFIVGLLILSLAIMSRNIFVPATAENLRLDEQDATIRAIKKAIPAVVTINVLSDESVAKLDEKSGSYEAKNERVHKTSGTGFLISKDGYILTNKHVISGVEAKKASYKVILNSGKEYFGQLIGTDPLNDLAVIRIFDKNLPAVEFGDSDKLQLGSSVIAIGNTLGRYKDSVTKGIVSGVDRNLVAGDGKGGSESLLNVIQTDAEINQGNSGGPLIDLAGKVVGINVAVDEAGTSIGFSIAINDAKPVIDSVLREGRIIRSMLGVRYMMLDEKMAKENNLKNSQGAWISSGIGSEVSPIIKGSPAEKAGILAGDIVLEINGIKLDSKNTLLSVGQKFKPGDKIKLKLQRDGKLIEKDVILEEFKN